MKRNQILLSTILLLATDVIFAQREPLLPRTDAPFWVNHFSRSPAIVFGTEEDDFYRNMQVVLFPWNGDESPTSGSILDSNARWLKDHPSVRFYISGYSSTRGDWLYNLNLSQRRADWVKQALVSRGIDGSRIKESSGWGQIYPQCAENDDACWSKNRVVRFIYSPE
jgi:outer membrane protein OmpA-like peptidoglycan-associated protein